jgi:hypothetical protein
MDVREGVGRLRRTFHRIGVETIDEQRRHIARHHRGAGYTVGPGHQPAVRVEPGRQPVVVIGPVHVVLDVFLAAPDDLHRPIHLPCDLDGEDGAVDVEPSAEAAAKQMIVHLDGILGRPVIPAMTAWVWVGAWVPTQMSQPSLRTCAVLISP